ncbi:MAG: hypothetical protein WDN26_05830 [Chitinophagaceae bacterium]
MIKLLFVLTCGLLVAGVNKPALPDANEIMISPLASYSPEWNKPVYQKCNTAASASYMSQPEKEMVWILNMARLNPSLFLSTVVKKYPQQTDKPWLKNVDEYKSLLDTMGGLKALPILFPDSLCWASAECHAIESGKKGYVGHTRQSTSCNKLKRFYGECCDYSNGDPLDMLMNLLIDQGVPSLGHRYICLGYYYNKIGISIQPHTAYGKNAVLDFY